MKYTVSYDHNAHCRQTALFFCFYTQGAPDYKMQRFFEKYPVTVYSSVNENKLNILMAINTA